MSVERLLEVYGHHHPDYLSDAVEKTTAKPKARGATATALPQKQVAQTKTNVTKLRMNSTYRAGEPGNFSRS